MSIKNNKDLDNVLKQILTASLDRVGDEVESVGQSTIQKVVYDRYSPLWYERTGQLRDKFVKGQIQDKGKNELRLEVGHHKGTLDYSNAYANSKKKTDSKYIPLLVQNGRMVGAVYNQGYWYEQRYYRRRHTFARPRPYMERLRNQMNKGRFETMVNKSLRYIGVKFERE